MDGTAVFSGSNNTSARFNTYTKLLEIDADGDAVNDICLVPAFDGAIFSLERKGALWDKFYTGAPRRLRRFVEQYKIVKKA
jgi:hypothetical protein